MIHDRPAAAFLALAADSFPDLADLDVRGSLGTLLVFLLFHRSYLCKAMRTQMRIMAPTPPSSQALCVLLQPTDFCSSALAAVVNLPKSVLISDFTSLMTGPW